MWYIFINNASKNKLGGTRNMKKDIVGPLIFHNNQQVSHEHKKNNKTCNVLNTKYGCQ